MSGIFAGSGHVVASAVDIWALFSALCAGIVGVGCLGGVVLRAVSVVKP